MESHVARMARGAAGERVWLLEHPSLYTAGTSAREEEILEARFPVHRTGRGGRVTWHGPGQRIAYVMLDLRGRGCDVRAFVEDLEAWLIGALACLGVEGVRRSGEAGVWIAQDGGLKKIAAIGLRLRRWISYHGVSLNVAPDLSAYEGIVPCGIADAGVTSLAALGLPVSLEEADRALQAAFGEVFGLRQVKPNSGH